MAVFFTCIILIGSGITLFSIFLMLNEKKRLYDYRTDLNEKKDGLIKVIEDAELLISEMNRFSDYVVTQIEDKNNTLTKTIAEADLKIELLSTEAESSAIPQPVYDEKSVCRIIKEECEQEQLKNTHSSAKKGKVLTFDTKRREITKLAKSGLNCTEIARILNCGKGEIELISRMGR